MVETEVFDYKYSLPVEKNLTKAAATQIKVFRFETYPKFAISKLQDT